MPVASCEAAGLCGISTSFPVLSHYRRQVAHALLTRPPLSFRLYCYKLGSVRLECVRHAASVHPEPGSNSRKICILSALAVNTFFELFFSSFTYLLACCVIKGIVEFPHLNSISALDHGTFSFSCCSIFKDRCCRLIGSAGLLSLPSLVRLCQYTTKHPCLSTLF